MSDDTISVFYDEVADLLPELTPAQCEEIDGYIKENDLDSARFLLRFWAKNRHARQGVGHESTNSTQA